MLFIPAGQIERSMFLKIHRSRDASDVVAVCDRELLNCTLRHGEVAITISPSFYGDTAVTEEEVRQALKRAGNINLMGERAVAIAIDMGLLTRDSCIMIGTVPHALIF